jgi:ribosomal protein S27E
MNTGDCMDLLPDGTPIFFLEVKCPRCGSDRAEPLNRKIVFVDWRCLDCGCEYRREEIHE